MPNACRFPGCDRAIGSGLLCCREHWKLIPPGQQKAIVRYYNRDRNQGLREPSREYHAAVKAGLGAAQKAAERVAGDRATIRNAIARHVGDAGSPAAPQAKPRPYGRPNDEDVLL